MCQKQLFVQIQTNFVFSCGWFAQFRSTKLAVFTVLPKSSLSEKKNYRKRICQFAQCEMIDDIIPDGIFLFLEFWNVSLDNFIKHNALVMPSFSSRRIAALFFHFDLSDLSLIIVTFYWIFRKSGNFNIRFWNNGCEFEIRHYKNFLSIY